MSTSTSLTFSVASGILVHIYFYISYLFNDKCSVWSLLVVPHPWGRLGHPLPPRNQPQVLLVVLPGTHHINPRPRCVRSIYIIQIKTTYTHLCVGRINAISAKVIDTEDSHPDPETSKKRVVLFGLILFMFIGAGISLAVSAKCYWSNPAVTIKYPGTTLTVGTVGICLSGLLFKFFRTHDVQF